MPGYRVHLGVAVVCYGAALIALSSYLIFAPTIKAAIAWFFCSVLGALFPDIDTKSKGQILFYQVISVVLLIFLYKRMFPAFVWTALIAMVPVLVNHRGLFHKPWFVVMVPFASSLFLSASYPQYQKMLLFDALFFSVGALSHIWLDRVGTRIKKFRW